MKNFKFEIQAKLADGTDVIFDGDFIVGTAVYVLDADGNKVPAPDAEHELEGGQKFTTVGGVITEIAAEQPASTDMPSTDTVVEVEQEEVVQEVKMVSDVEFQALVQEVADLKTKLESLMMMKENFELLKEQKLASIELQAEVVDNKVSKTDEIYRKIEMFRK